MNVSMQTERNHYTQRVYRSLLDAMAKPGTIVQLEAYSYSGCASELQHMLGIGLTLLDQEVSYYATSSLDELAVCLQLLAKSTVKSLSECDYIFAQSEDPIDLSALKKGSLEYPDQSATVIYLVKRITDSTDDQDYLKLRGPGIRTEKELALEGFHHELLSEWKECNREFPLGIDWIFVDESGRACCIPRSTALEWGTL